jgi:integrase
MPKLTKRTVEAIQHEAEGDLVVWDSELPGFGVRVWPSGKRVYILKYRTQDGRQRKATLGPHGPLTTEHARAQALQWLGDAHKGGDPARAKTDARRSLTVASLCEQYLEEHARPKKKPSSVKSDEALIRLHVLPHLGNLKVPSIERSDISQLHHSMRVTPGAANRTLALLSKMFNLAEKWGLRPDGSNPCRHVERYRERKFERFLSNEELARLGIALADAEHENVEMPSVITAIRLLLFVSRQRLLDHLG